MSIRPPKPPSRQIPYKNHSLLTNPQHNKPITHFKPAVVKGEENCSLDANALAQLEVAKAEEARQQQREKIERFDYLVRVNASRISEQRSIIVNETRKIKEQTVIKKNNIKAKYTVTPATKLAKDCQQPKKIEATPTKIEWKKASEIPQPDHQQPQILEVKAITKDPVKPRSVSPAARTSQQSRIEIPKSIDAESQASASEIDSDVEQRVESVKEVLGKFEKLRAVLRKR